MSHSQKVGALSANLETSDDIPWIHEGKRVDGSLTVLVLVEVELHPEPPETPLPEVPDDPAAVQRLEVLVATVLKLVPVCDDQRVAV